MSAVTTTPAASGMSTGLSDRTLRRLSWASFGFYVGSIVFNLICPVLDPTEVTDWGSGGWLPISGSSC